MPKAESEINEIKKYFVTWISEVALANALNFYDINRISEGTCAKLLNLVFDYQLQDLNKIKPNYPGIDLGDKPNGLAFQVTSRMDAAKIIHSLKSFADNGYGKDFPKGIRFFIINSGKRPAVKAARLTGYEQIFDLKSDVYFPADVIRLIEGIYYADAAKFAVIKEFLQAEFSNHPAKKTIIQLIGSAGKLDFYKKLFIANNERTAKRFVPFSCKAGDADITTEQLVDVMFAGKGATITGPSGCGKSILARKLALAFLQQGIPVLLEAKYYEGSLNTLFEKEVVAYGFATGAEYFAICKEHQLKSLLVIDGLNECKATHSPKFLLELENVMNNYPVTVIITTQVIDEEIGSLGLARVDVGYPEQATKKAIAASYSGKKLSPKLDPILQMVSSSMEAKMIGEIGSEEVDHVSRFTLFEIFISGKLGDYKSNGFLLLAAVASVLSEKITFNLSERAIDGLLRSNKLTDEVYRQCLSSGLVEQRLGQVSFMHEMFFNFFVADSIVRFAKDTDEIVTAINAPKNRDKRLLVIGSIDDSATLEMVLAGLTDVELLTSLYAGEGGNYCQQWIKKQVKEIFKKIGEEINHLQFELGDATLTGIQFKEESFRKWTELESTVIYTVPCILVRDQFLPQVFELVGLMDDVCHAASKALSPEAREKGFSAATAIFSTTYIGGGVKNAALTKIFSTLQSGFATFRNAATISDQSILAMLKKRSLKHGQFYFLLSLLRYDDKLRLLYPYVLHLLKNWRAYPYHLTQEVLQQVAHSYETEEQRRELVAVLNKMHGETQNAWLSTNLFDALGDLGALEDDAAEYEPSVADEIRQALAYPLEKESWDRAAGIYYAQFDHPYNSAYQSIIRQLPEQEKKQFLSLALQGYYSSIFTTSLIRDGWANLQAGVAPFLVRWTEVPIINPSFPQDSITVFLVAHILLAKSNYPVQSRYGAEQDEKRRSLFAAAEIYYWLNRADAKPAENMIQAKAAADILFSPKNAYVIESIWQLHHNLSQSGLYHVFEPGLIMTIELAFPEMVVGACRASLNNIGFQTDIENFPRDGHEIVLHTIWLLENTGSIIDLDVLRPLTDHVVYGESAVKAIKELSLK